MAFPQHEVVTSAGRSSFPLFSHVQVQVICTILIITWLQASANQRCSIAYFVINLSTQSFTYHSQDTYTFSKQNVSSWRSLWSRVTGAGGAKWRTPMIPKTSSHFTPQTSNDTPQIVWRTPQTRWEHLCKRLSPGAKSSAEARCYSASAHINILYRTYNCQRAEILDVQSCPCLSALIWFFTSDFRGKGSPDLNVMILCGRCEVTWNFSHQPDFLI